MPEPANAVELLAALGHDNPTPTYTPAHGRRIPIERWGSDHWSTFAYLEVRIVDHRGKISHDHMRCHSHHPAMLTAKRRGAMFGTGAGDQYPTRLRDGEVEQQHDDYDCIDDMIAAGLVTVTMPAAPAGTLVTGLVESELMTRATYALTDRGREMAAALRGHRGSGGSWATFVAPAEAPAQS